MDNKKYNRVNPKLYAFIEDRLNLYSLSLTKKVITLEEAIKSCCINKSLSDEKNNDNKSD